MTKQYFIDQNKLTNKTKNISCDNCEYFSFFNKFKEKPMYKVFNRHSIDFRLNFFKSLSFININTKTNIKISDFFTIKKFVNLRPFSILQCDKNIGVAILAHELEDKLAYDHLADNNIYKKLDYDPTQDSFNLICNLLKMLINSKDLSKSLANKLIPKNFKCGTFRILPKLHKSKFGIRPIINCKNHLTSHISLLIQIILQPLIIKQPSYLKDTQELLQICENLSISSSEVFLYSCDFESLYTNINKDHAITLITDYVKDTLDINHITPNGFHKLITILFEFNIFKYTTSFFKQVSGVAMGCICGPDIANAYVYLLERKWLSINKHIIYKRYIDDIVLIDNKKLDCESFSNSFENLKINICHESKINFLDTTISFDTITGKINFSLYVKPTNTFSYLLTSSNHPDYIFKNIPISLFIRIRRICTSYLDYLYHALILFSQLRSRGYDKKTLLNSIFTIGKKDRKELIKYKPKIKTSMDDNIFAKISFNFNTCNLNNIYMDIFNNIKNTNSFFTDKKLFICNTMSINLSSIFIHKFKITFPKSYFTKPCLSHNCKTCHFIYDKSFFTLNNNIYLPLLCNANCNTSNIIYIIYCTMCNLFYIGETSKSLKSRFSSHKHCIKKFHPFLNFTSEIGDHFNKRGHELNKHLKLAIFKKDFKDSKQRFSTETDLIHFISNLHPPIINSRIPSLFSINSLSFT